MPTPKPLAQLATRIPYELRRRVKVHCTRRDVTLSRFIIDAIVERLDAEGTSGASSTRRSAS